MSSYKHRKWITRSSLLLILTLFTASCGNQLPSQSPNHVRNITPTGNSSVPLETITNNEDETSNLSSNSCLSSFNAFSFHPDQKKVTKQRVFPLSPWQYNTTIPTRVGRDKLFSGYSNIVLTRLKDGQLEIWLNTWFKNETSANQSNEEQESGFVVYSPDIGSWKVVPSKIAQTDLSVYNLFLLSDGSVWGDTYIDLTIQHPGTENVPILSRYNELSQRFEIPPGVGEFPYEQLKKSGFNPKIFLDGRDTFWIFVDKDGLYRYDLSGQHLQKQVDLPDTIVEDAAIASGGIIYFLDKNKYDISYQLTPGMLVQFNPATKEMSPLAIPQERWPTFMGMLVDNRGNLWLGATGYRTPTGDWRSIVPDPGKFFEHVGDIAWSFPRLVYQSSNGLLWYSKYLDSDGRWDGTAWYNPRTGEGCLFTNHASIVIEDPLHRMWLVASKQIYMYDMKNPSK